jgi:hypothetical protein
VSVTTIGVAAAAVCTWARYCGAFVFFTSMIAVTKRIASSV